MELTNDRDHILWHAKTGEYCPEEGSINGVVRFGKFDKAYIERNSFLPRQLLQPTNHKQHIGGRTVRSETTLFLRQDPNTLTVTVLAEAASDDLQQFLAGMHYQRDAPVVVVAALCQILLFVEYVICYILVSGAFWPSVLFVLFVECSLCLMSSPPYYQ